MFWGPEKGEEAAGHGAPAGIERALPLALSQSEQGAEVLIVDGVSRRKFERQVEAIPRNGRT